MATGARVVGTGALVLVLAAGAYATADARDLVPGVLTLAAPPADPAPFPPAPGAVAPAQPVAALDALDPQAPVPQGASLQKLVDALVRDERMGAHTGVVVADQLTGEVLAQHAGDDPHIPASTAKLVTAVAALSTLEPTSTLRTTVVRGSGDDVVLVGGGDMMLAPGAGDPALVDGHAGLGDLAQQTARALQLEGVTSVHVRVDDTLFSGPRVNPRWDPDNLAMGYVAPVSPLAVHIAKMRDEEYPPRFPDPALSAARTFAQQLEKAGITVDGEPSRGTARAGARQLGAVESAPLYRIVHYFLDTSDNTITEVVSRLVAIDAGLPASFQGGTQAVLHAAGALGVDVAGAHLEDASGLADGSVLRPATLVGLLRLVTDPAQPQLRDVATGMPIAGLSGTLSDRYTQSDARGFVRAKTGSLPHVTSLAGTVLDADGRQLVFVVMADKTPDGGQWGPRAAIDGFVSKVQGCGCG